MSSHNNPRLSAFPEPIVFAVISLKAFNLAHARFEKDGWQIVICGVNAGMPVHTVFARHHILNPRPELLRMIELGEYQLLGVY